jgi:hypothetical protein
MNVIDLLFTSEWVAMLFVVIFTSIAAKNFILPKSFEKERLTRMMLMKRQEERRNAQKNAYGY